MQSEIRIPKSAILFSCRLGPFGAILRAPLFAIGNSHRIERAANHVVAHAGQILNTATANQNDRMFLQVMTNAGNVGRDFNSISQSNSCHLAQRRVWLLGCLRIDARTNATLLRRTLERRAGGLILDCLATLANKLIYCGHVFLSLFFPLATARGDDRTSVSSAQKGVTCLFPELVG
jgi:hypothetical protein